MVDGVIHSTDPIFTSGRPRILYVCFSYEVIRRMTCSIQNEHVMGCDVATCFICVHSACMDVVSIANGNVGGCFRDVLALEVLFCRYITMLR
jgi:hypothetical protein